MRNLMQETRGLLKSVIGDSKLAENVIRKSSFQGGQGSQNSIGFSHC